jgi:NtrC-family two-component system sensor histidine kinase KinB
LVSKNDRLTGIAAETLPDTEIELRKRWLEFGPDDERLIAEVDPILEQHVCEIIDDMYAHFLSFDETRAFFPDDATLKRASTAQTEYFRRLTKGRYNSEYVSDRLRIGSTHYRIDLSPQWYMGAYNRVMSWMTRLLFKHFHSDPQKLLAANNAIRKLVFFDMGLAIETYIAAKEAAIRTHRDAIAELETERRVTKSLLESAPLGIVELDNKFHCLECNQEFMTMLGATDRADIIGKQLFDLAPYLPREPFQNAAETGQSFSATGDHLNFSTGSVSAAAHWDWAAWPMKDTEGKTTGIVAKFTNVTDRVMLQTQREDFVATLTHDLKTPILAANRAVKLLLEGDFGPVAESQARILETIHESNEAMYKLVQTLLDVYRYDSGAKRLNFSSHNLTEIIRKLLAELQPLATQKSIDLQASLPQSPVNVHCDEDEIRRVVQNLIDNSLKFTPSGGKITIEMNQARDNTTISVTDTGKGIPQEDMPKLFQRFWQAASSGRYYASTGLGLYLCRKIVELHGGRIWCESATGKGSTFAFVINNKVSQYNAELS